MKTDNHFSHKLRIFSLILVSLFLWKIAFPQKISELPPATFMGTGDLMPIVQNGVTKKLPYSSLLNSLKRFSDSIYVNYRCHSVKGQSKWYSIGDTIYIDTCSVTGSLVGATELNDLTDVTLTEPDAGDVLIVDDESMQWVNVPVSDLFTGPTELNDLSDVTITTPDSADILSFNDDLSQWENVPFPVISSGATELNDLSDVILTEPDQGDMLRLNETNHWVNVEMPFYLAPSGIEDGEQGITSADQVYDFVTGELSEDSTAAIHWPDTTASGHRIVTKKNLADSTAAIRGAIPGGVGYYAITMGGPSAVFSDGSTWYAGIGNYGTSPGFCRFVIPQDGTIKAITGHVYTNTIGSNEAWVMSLVLNSSTSIPIDTVSTNNNQYRTWTNFNMNTSVVQGDYITVKWVNPTWATNPSTTNGYQVVVYIQ